MKVVKMMRQNNCVGNSHVNSGTVGNTDRNQRMFNGRHTMNLAPEFITSDLLVHQQQFWTRNGAVASGQESGVC